MDSIQDSRTFKNLSNARMANNDTTSEDTSTETQSVHPIIYCTFIAVIALVGVFGNVSNVFVFSNARYRRQSFSVYMRALALSDSCLLLVTLTADVSGRLIPGDPFFTTESICPMAIMLYPFFKVLSSLLLVAIAADRYIAVVYPLHKARLCTLHRSRYVTVGLVISAACITLPDVIWNAVEGPSVESDPVDGYHCPPLEGAFETYNIAVTLWSFVFSLSVPFCTICALNGRVMWTLKKGRDASFPGSESKARLANRSSLKLTVSLVVMTALSVSMLFPIIVIEIVEFTIYLGQYEEHSTVALDRAWAACNFIELVNYSMNFYVFCLMSKEHRQIWFHRWKATKQSNESSYQNTGPSVQTASSDFQPVT